MKVMLLSDLVIMRKILTQMMGIFLAIALFLTIATGTVISSTSAMAVMVPAMFVISIAAYDQLNHWESFRLSLPLSRADVVKGRYASTAMVVAGSYVLALLTSGFITAIFTPLSNAGLLGPLDYYPSSLGEIAAASTLGLAVSLWIPAISLPLSLRYGLTRMTRFAPVVVAFTIALTFSAVSSLDPSLSLVSWLLESGIFDLLNTGYGVALATLVALAISAAIFAGSLPIALRLYQNREL